LPSGQGWDVPTDLKQWSVFHWYKIGPRQGLDCVILSSEPLWYLGHYHDGRMWPCSKTDCPFCAEQIGTQVRWVFAVVSLSTRRVGLLEVSDSVAWMLRDWIPRFGALRGMHVFFQRHSHSIKSRIEVEYIDEESVAWWRDLPVPDAQEALDRTWEKMGAVKLPANSELPSSRFRHDARRAS